MTVSIIQTNPIIRISVTADIGNAAVGASRDYVDVVTQTGAGSFLLSTLGDDSRFDVVDENGATQALTVSGGTIQVIEADDNPSTLSIVDVQ